MTRAQILEAARKCVCGGRDADYGAPEDNFATTADLWMTYLQAAHPNGAPDITTKDVAALMCLLKIARIAKGDKADNFIDLAGYAACGGELVTGGVDFENPPF